jgi:CspA family cold shock protein
MIGTVTYFNVERAYGFLRTDAQGADVFFHKTALPRAALGATVGERFQFDVIDDKLTGKTKAASMSPASARA